VSPDRITAAKLAAEQFVTQLPERFNVGLVAFSSSAAIVVPATQEHAAVSDAIAALRLGTGTAIGEAVLASLQAVQAVPGASGSQAAPAHIVLLSDGANTVGTSVEAAEAQAVSAGVPISTIAYGTQDGVVTVGGEAIRVPVDGPALAALAQRAGGKSYEAVTGDELKSVYSDIGSSVGTTSERREVSAGVAGLALLVAIGAAASAAAMAPRLG
jgi:Ca-activated chloride channel family protein